jgi:hypothetical protein
LSGVPERGACHCKTGSPDDRDATTLILLALIPTLSPGLCQVQELKRAAVGGGIHRGMKEAKSPWGDLLMPDLWRNRPCLLPFNQIPQTSYTDADVGPLQ